MADETQVTTTATESAPSYAERVAAARSEMNDFFADGAAEERAPADSNQTQTAPPSEQKATDAPATTHGPDGKTEETRPAADEPFARDRSGGTRQTVPQTEGKTEATTAATPAKDTKSDEETRSNNERRASAEQAKLARELQQAQARLAELERERNQLDFDNRVLFNATEEAKRIAREQGAVRYEEMDDAQRGAIQQQAAIRQADEARRQQAENLTRQQQEVWQREVGDRTQIGNLERERGIARVLEVAAEHGLKVTRAEVEASFKEGYTDKRVAADIRDWQDWRVPGDIARQRVGVAFERQAELAIEKLTAKAVAAIQGDGTRQAYDRTQIHGGSIEQVPQGGSGRDRRPYEERKRQALAEANDWFDQQHAKLSTI